MIGALDPRWSDRVEHIASWGWGSMICEGRGRVVGVRVCLHPIGKYKGESYDSRPSIPLSVYFAYEIETK